MFESILNTQGVPVMLLVLAGAITFSFGIVSEKRRQKFKQRQMLSVIYGELQNVIRHYEYIASVDFRSSPSAAEKIKLTMAKYGSSKIITSHLEEIAFLSSDQIASLLQLAMYIRNNDMIIDTIIMCCDRLESDHGALEDIDLKKINSRANRTKDWATQIVNSLKNNQKFLQSAKSFIG